MWVESCKCCGATGEVNWPQRLIEYAHTETCKKCGACNKGTDKFNTCDVCGERLKDWSREDPRANVTVSIEGDRTIEFNAHPRCIAGLADAMQKRIGKKVDSVIDCDRVDEDTKSWWRKFWKSDGGTK